MLYRSLSKLALWSRPGGIVLTFDYSNKRVLSVGG